MMNRCLIMYTRTYFVRCFFAVTYSGEVFVRFSPTGHARILLYNIIALIHKGHYPSGISSTLTERK